MNNQTPQEVITELSNNTTNRAKLPIAKISKKRNGTTRSFPYSAKLADKILSLVSEGKSVTHILSYKNMPSVHTFMKWMDENPELRTEYTRARAQKPHFLVEKALEAPDLALNEINEADPDDRRVNARVQAYRLRADINTKVAGLYNREEYGDTPAVQVNTAVGIQLQMLPSERIVTKSD